MFAHLRLRSVPRQDHFLPLAEVAKHEAHVTFREAEGTLAGFFSPRFMASLCVPGLRLHFLSSDRTQGGHLLSCRPADVRAQLLPIFQLELSLPKTAAYLGLDLGRDVAADLEQAGK